MSTKILVTGASGFTGSRLCQKLVQRGDRVLGLVRPGRNTPFMQDLGVVPIYCDLSNESPPVADLRGVEVIFHVAAVYRQQGLPEKYFFDVNGGGTERMLEAALRADVPRFVHTSTVGVLGNIQNPPGTETSPYNPGDIYQRSKLAGELAALRYFNEHQLPVSVVRPGAIYGPGDMRFLKLFRSINRGWFRMIGTGDIHYHLVYIDDLLDGMVLASEKPDIAGEVFIIAGESPICVRELVHIIADTLGKPVSNLHIPAQPVMLAAHLVQWASHLVRVEPPLYPRRMDFFVKNRAFSIEKAKRILGYRPKVNVKTGVALTAEWYQSQGLLAERNRSERIA
ncbi:MAG: NAD-dependent epimerase/dehydratase family protein [Anaerolineales bacterium]